MVLEGKSKNKSYKIHKIMKHIPSLLYTVTVKVKENVWMNDISKNVKKKK